MKNVSKDAANGTNNSAEFRKMYNEIFMHHRKLQKEIYRKLNPSVTNKKK